MNSKRQLVAIPVLALALQGCFTTMLWGGEIRRETGSDESSIHFDAPSSQDETPGWDLIVGRILLTPIMLVLDCATAPVQAFLYGWDDDDDD